MKLFTSQLANCKRANNESLSLWIELNWAHTFSCGLSSYEEKPGSSSHCFAFQILIQQIGHVYQPKGVRDFHLFSRGWSVCGCTWQIIKQTLFIYLAQRGDITYCLLQVGPGGRCGSMVCVCMCVWESLRADFLSRHILQAIPCGRSRGVWQISSPGRIGVNEHFNHLAQCQSLLGVIIRLSWR